MRKEQGIILAITIVAVAALVYPMLNKAKSGTASKVEQKPAKTKVDFLPSADKAARFHAEDLDVLFVGDIAFAEETSNKALIGKSYGVSFSPFAKLLNASDVVIGNLATGLADVPPVVSGKSALARWSKRTEAIETLKTNNFSALSLANAHAGALGAQNLKETVAALKERGIEPIGFADDAGAIPWRFQRKAGDRIKEFAIIASTETEPPAAMDPTGSRIVGSEAPAGAAIAKAADGRLSLLRENGIVERIRAIKQESPETFVVVYPSWGRRHQWKRPTQIQMAHQFIDAGADLIVGHGAEMLQQLEHYNNRGIVYGIGNFVSNYPFGKRDDERIASDRDALVPMSLVVRVTVSGRNSAVRVRIYPIVTDNETTQYRPYFVDSVQFNRAYWKMVLRQWIKKDGGLKRFIDIGQDEFGRYLHLGAKKEK